MVGPLLGTGALTSLAGCNDDDGGGGGGNGDGDGSTYTDWLAPPDAFGMDHYTYTYLNVAAITENESAFSETFQDRFESSFQGLQEVLGVDREDVDWQARGPIDSAVVVSGSFDTGALADSFDDWNAADDYEGFSVYESTAGDQTWGFTDSIVVGAETADDGSVGSTEAFRAAVDAGTGGDRYVDANDAFGEIVAHLDADATTGFGRTQEPSGADGTEVDIEGIVGNATQWTVDGETAAINQAVIFEDADAVDQEAVVASAEQDETATDVSGSTDGRVVTVTASTDTGQVPFFYT